MPDNNATLLNANVRWFKTEEAGHPAAYADILMEIQPHENGGPYIYAIGFWAPFPEGKSTWYVHNSNEWSVSVMREGTTVRHFAYFNRPEEE